MNDKTNCKNKPINEKDTFTDPNGHFKVKVRGSILYLLCIRCREIYHVPLETSENGQREINQDINFYQPRHNSLLSRVLRRLKKFLWGYKTA